MGIYDRDYSRDDEPGITLGSDWMMVTRLVAIIWLAYLVELLIDPGGRLLPFADKPMEYFLSLHRNLFSSETLTHPWRVLGLVTHGFVHDRDNILHILGNTFVLWFFGRDIERRYGSRDFLWLYITALIFSGLVWIACGYIPGASGKYAVGASGAVTAVFGLYVINFPKRVLLIWGVLPAPAWLLGAIWLFSDLSGAIGRAGGVAYEAHLGGALYAVLYWKTRFSLGRIMPASLGLSLPRRKPKLRIHDPDEREVAMGDEVDQILRKIQDHGQDSLTAKERRTLERASRRYKQKHR